MQLVNTLLVTAPRQHLSTLNLQHSEFGMHSSHDSCKHTKTEVNSHTVEFHGSLTYRVFLRGHLPPPLGFGLPPLDMLRILFYM